MATAYIAPEQAPTRAEIDATSGPVVLSLVLSAYRIYRYDVLRWRALPVPEPPPDPPAESSLPAAADQELALEGRS